MKGFVLFVFPHKSQQQRKVANSFVLSGNCVSSLNFDIRKEAADILKSETYRKSRRNGNDVTVVRL